ncbi:MAG: sulfatase-like hydrolase/transferase [Halopseudomonas sp.]
MIKTKIKPLSAIVATMLALTGVSVAASAKELIHDAEFYVIQAQNADRWAAEDQQLTQMLQALNEKYGRPPNIVHIMWDDTSVGDVGIPAISKMRGFSTPNIDRMAQQGILFTRMYTENSCTPSRAASMTGRYAARTGTFKVGFPLEGSGLAGKEVTIAEVLSEAGYATAFFGKWHLGDIEQSYPHNQGFDEALFTPYNQALSLWNNIGESVNAAIGLQRDSGLLVKDPYSLDATAVPKGYLMTMEGKKGQQAREWGDTSHKSYVQIDPEAQKRTLEFMQRQNAAQKPFYVAYWPNLTSFIPVPKKHTRNRSIYAEGMHNNVDPFIGKVMEELKAMGITENTLVVAMADNGPMVHQPPPGLGMVETIYRGGKGDYWEGGIRVAAFAQWPGMIEPGQIVGDMLHQTDLFTTFARLGGALDAIPGDRIIDGIDQTAALLNGDSHGRRDYNYVYQGDYLAATIKEDIKRVWPQHNEGALPEPVFYNLLLDTREQNPRLVNYLHFNSGHNRMRQRHLNWKQTYPDRTPVHDKPFTGVVDARPATQALWGDRPDLDVAPPAKR